MSLDSPLASPARESSGLRLETRLAAAADALGSPVPASPAGGASLASVASPSVTSMVKERQRRARTSGDAASPTSSPAASGQGQGAGNPGCIAVNPLLALSASKRLRFCSLPVTSTLVVLKAAHIRFHVLTTAI